MALKASCGGNCSNRLCQRRSLSAIGVKTSAKWAGSGASPSKAGNQPGALSAPRDRKCCTHCTSSASSKPNSGDFSACASDTSWRGDTSASTRASKSCTTGSSCSSVFSANCAGRCKASSSCLNKARRSRLRASTITSQAWIVPASDAPSPRNACANQRAACRASSTLRLSSGLWRAMVSESRHTRSSSSSWAAPAATTSFKTCGN